MQATRKGEGPQASPAAQKVQGITIEVSNGKQCPVTLEQNLIDSPRVPYVLHTFTCLLIVCPGLPSLGHESITCFRKISIKQLKWLGYGSVAAHLPNTYEDPGSITSATKKQEKDQIIK